MRWRWRFLAIWVLWAACGRALAADPVSFTSPGFPPTTMDAEGRLVEDWGTLGLVVQGEGVVEAPVTVEALKLDGGIPAARAASQKGLVNVMWTAYRAPVFPGGVDVVSARVETPTEKPAKVSLVLKLPEGAELGYRTAKVGGRTVLALPAEGLADRGLLDWGFADEATTLPNWARPSVPCDPAFRNIRAGMGGVPIAYRFKVEPAGSAAQVVLGICESHWGEPGARVLTCAVEGATAQEVDPVAKWGQHKPGILVFAGKDENGDGLMDLSVRAAATATDRNPILNVIWFFPLGEKPDPVKLLSGELSAAATRYVDVGGERDQSIFPPGDLKYELAIPGNGVKELSFLVACPDASAPIPDVTTWNMESLKRAAAEVWRDWPAE